MQHGKIIIQEAQSNNAVCRKLHYFTLTDDERFSTFFLVFQVLCVV